MILSIAIGAVTMLLCLVIQLVLLVRIGRYYFSHHALITSQSFAQSIVVLTSVMVLLVLGNLLQAGLWALLFMVLDEFQTFEVAFYFSLVNFATLGYGDIVMSDQWRLLGPIQAINGVLMIGVSTATIGQATQDALRHVWSVRQKSVDDSTSQSVD